MPLQNEFVEAFFLLFLTKLLALQFLDFDFSFYEKI